MKNYVTPVEDWNLRIIPFFYFIAATIMLSHGIPPVIVEGMLGHSFSILLNTYAHFIPTMQDQAAQLMDDILTPIPIELVVKGK